MDDYISRQALLRDIEKYHLSDGKFQHWVEVQPSADVVEVVRCKDCKWGRWDIFDRGMYCGRKNVTLDTHEDDYCSYGERMDGKQNDIR